MFAQENNEPWYVIQNINAVDTPALVVYRDRVLENIGRLKNSIDDPERLRPHVKTNKSREASLLLLHAGLKKFKCATIAEAEMLAMINAPDVLLAYQPIGPKAERFIAMTTSYPGTTFSCLVDTKKVAEQLSQLAVQAGIVVPVYIDLNVGMNRTGILPDAAFELYCFCATLPGIKPVGLHVYDGHITDAGFEQRTQKCNAVFEPVEQVKHALMKANFETPVIVAGGSATFSIHAKRKGVECSPGTFIYWDAGYAQTLPEQPFQPAALVIARVISLPDAKTICVDLGHKAVASENVLNKRVVFLNAPELIPKSHSEEHMVLEAPENHTYKIGDVLYGVPYHICPTCALYERALVVENGVVTSAWKTIARDRKLFQ